MKCEYCGKKIKRKWARKYCSRPCNLKDYTKKKHNFCKCGNKKWYLSKHCKKCHASNKIKGQLSRIKK